jgi:cold shock CspA family protein
MSLLDSSYKVFKSFFTDLVGDADPNMLIECFVETKESRIADFALEKLTTYVLGNISPPDKEVDESLRQLIASTIADKHGDTVFIVGPSGAGKTTFLERFFRATLPPNIRERCIVINVNALDATGDEGASLAWFDAIKGYGFVTVEQLGSAFLHVSVLEKSGIDEVHDGDALVVDVSRSHKGIAISEVRKAQVVQAKDAELVRAVIVKLFEDRGYGFVFVPSLNQDAFFHVSILPEADRSVVKVGTKLRAEINADPRGRGLQVRRVA